jgi:hypothetical protein
MGRMSPFDQWWLDRGDARRIEMSRSAAKEAWQAREPEIVKLRAEVERLTKILDKPGEFR